MRILITTQVFPPEVHPSAVMVQELAAAMAGKGWEVTVAAGYPHHPRGQLYPGYNRKWAEVEEHCGFRVVRGWHLVSSSPAIGVRGVVLASQCAAFLPGAWKSPAPHVVISYGPPLLGPLMSALVAMASGARLVTAIYDLYPDIAVAGGHLQNGALVGMARKAEQMVYRSADSLVVLSEGFRRTLVEDKGVEPCKVEVIPVWLDRRDITPMNRDNPWRREMNIPLEKFVVLYAGTIGLVSGAEVVLGAARRLESHPDILFLFVGEGQMKDRLEVQAREEGLTNVRFLTFQPRERLSEVQATADVSLVTLAPGRGKTSVPSKVMGYMAAARSVIAAVEADCDTARIINEAECGLIVPPSDPPALAAAVLRYFRGPEAGAMEGQRGRRAFLAGFEKEAVLARYLALVQRTATSDRRTPGA